jgi:hypothetical protein
MSSPKIDKYKFGQIVIDGEIHNKDVIILPERVIAGWWRREGHALQPEDLEVLLEHSLDVLCVGQGAYGRMRVTAAAREALKAAGIELVSEDTESACQRYNQLREQCKAAAALHLTC